MDYEQTIRTSAGVEDAWAALSAVTTYPQWTTSMSSVTPLDGAELEAGRRFRIKQPGFPPVVWHLTEVRPGESFVWEAKSPGLHSLAFHRVSRDADGTTRFTIGVRQNGALAGLMARLTAKRTRHYLQLEAAGLKAAAEATAAKTTATTDRRTASR
ncbi:MAG TPA: SRPBCC family protein [Micromonosporaceae bacterium]